MRHVDLDPERLHAVAQLLADFPDLDVERVRALLEVPAGRRPRAEPVKPRSWSEITAAVESGWLTKNEARKAAGFRVRSGPVRKPKETGS